MNPSDVRLYSPFIAMVIVLVLLSPRILEPRRLQVGWLWFGPAFLLTGIFCYYVTQPMPSMRHGLVLAWALVLGGVIGWARSKLMLIALDPATGAITQQATPGGLFFLAALLAVRSGVGILAAKHPQLGINLHGATDTLMFFGFGLLSTYAGELREAVVRARRAHHRLA